MGYPLSTRSYQQWLEDAQRYKDTLARDGMQNPTAKPFSEWLDAQQDARPNDVTWLNKDTVRVVRDDGATTIHVNVTGINESYEGGRLVSVSVDSEYTYEVGRA